MLGVLNGRRFELLMEMLAAAEPLTTTEIADRLPPRSRGSLHRDLASLEAVGLVRGDPAGAMRQQGRRVTYEAVSAVVVDTFESLAHQVQDVT
ncbi:helix-turn-helix domain-containing protein [Arsenicicoccus bolidensis]|uniref:helix-turn-helix domain-containing protein n=1 Tax=Arsenicicoccus bolidensis TaxID=229480 RepID=UPI0028AAA055|nr:helix-turn-helix domain-containing protein [Arsenicicoccus bolidensis]